MTRISPRVLVQGLDDGVVIVDDNDGSEITVPAEYLDNLITAAAYFRDAFTERLHPAAEEPVPASADVPVDPALKPPRIGRRLGKGRWSS